MKTEEELLFPQDISLWFSSAQFWFFITVWVTSLAGDHFRSHIVLKQQNKYKSSPRRIVKLPHKPRNKFLCFSHAIKRWSYFSLGICSL